MRRAAAATSALAVEFRHKTLDEERNAEETLSFLEEHDLPFVCVDMPQGFDSSSRRSPRRRRRTSRWSGSTGATPRCGEEGRERLRAVPLRVLGARAPGVGPEDPRPLGAGARDPRPDEQLLPGLRGEQRSAAGATCSTSDARPDEGPARPRGHARVEGRVGRAGRHSPRTRCRSPGTRSNLTAAIRRFGGVRTDPPAPFGDRIRARPTVTRSDGRRARRGGSASA